MQMMGFVQTHSMLSADTAFLLSHNPEQLGIVYIRLFVSILHADVYVDVAVPDVPVTQNSSSWVLLPEIYE